MRLNDSICAASLMRKRRAHYAARVAMKIAMPPSSATSGWGHQAQRRCAAKCRGKPCADDNQSTAPPADFDIGQADSAENLTRRTRRQCLALRYADFDMITPSGQRRGATM